MKEKKSLKEIINERVRGKTQRNALFYTLIGGYLVYIAYSLIKNYSAEEASMPLWAAIAFVVFFALFGLCTLAFGLCIYSHLAKEGEDGASETDGDEAEAVDEEETENTAEEIIDAEESEE